MSHPERTATVTARGLGVRFGGVRAVRDVDFDVPYGQRRAIIGPNGAGKTTLFRLLSGEVRPSEGKIEIFGNDVTFAAMRSRARAGVGRTFQTPLVFDGLTVLDNLNLALVGTGRGRYSLRRVSSSIRQQSQALAEWTGTEPLLNHEMQDLAHGQRRQVEIAMALAGTPQLLMLDEPAAGLSALERQDLTVMLHGLDRNITVLFIEHDMDIALGVADQITVMHDGEVIREGNSEAIRSDELVHRIYMGTGGQDD